MKPKTPYFIEALARGLDVLALFSREKPSLTMSEVVERTDLSKATAYRVLSTLEATGYLDRDMTTRRYTPGLKVLRLGFTAINNLDVRQVARPFLEKLAGILDLTTSLSILDGMEVVYIDRIRNREIVGVLLGLGDRIPAHCSSMGKVMLAHLSREALETRLQNAVLNPCAPKSITSLEQFREELAQVRKQGYSFNNGELVSGLKAIAAPIFNAQGEVVAAVNVSGSQDVIDNDRLHQELPPRIVDTAQQISRALGMAGE